MVLDQQAYCSRSIMENIKMGLKPQKFKLDLDYVNKVNAPRVSKIKYKEKIIQIKRVTKVVKGGKNLSFRVVVIVGDTKHKVGIGIGKSADVSVAIEKAILNAKKNLIEVPLTHSLSIASASSASVGASLIVLRPAAIGTGIIAGGSVRAVLELAGIKNASGKQLGSKSLLNNAKATIKALSFLKQKVEVSRHLSNKTKSLYQKILRRF